MAGKTGEGVGVSVSVSDPAASESSKKLEIHFSSNDLRVVRSAGESIVVARRIVGVDAAYPWVAWEPFESNVVSWIDAWGLYAADPDVPAATFAATGHAVDAGYSYALSPDRTFVRGDAVAPGSFELVNDVPWSAHRALLFGLTQDANVNGALVPAARIDRVTVPAAQLATIVPASSLSVWLESTDARARTVRSEPVTVEYSSGVSVRALAYRPARGTFIAVDPTS
jgi:hypothetical protein